MVAQVIHEQLPEVVEEEEELVMEAPAEVEVVPRGKAEEDEG
jgi:hypothetical protein